MTPQLLVSWQPAVAPMQCTSLINGRPLKFLWISLRCPNDLIFAGTRSPLVYQRPMSAAPCSLISALSRWTFLLKFKIELTPVPSRWTFRASPASTVLTTVTATMSRTQTGAWQTEGNVSDTNKWSMINPSQGTCGIYHQTMVTEYQSLGRTPTISFCPQLDRWEKSATDIFQMPCNTCIPCNLWCAYARAVIVI